MVVGTPRVGFRHVVSLIQHINFEGAVKRWKKRRLIFTGDGSSSRYDMVFAVERRVMAD